MEIWEHANVLQDAHLGELYLNVSLLHSLGEVVEDLSLHRLTELLGKHQLVNIVVCFFDVFGLLNG